MTTYRRDPDAIKALTDEQFWVTQENRTERPGSGRLLSNKDPGIYVDVVSAQPVSANPDKHQSGCGRPSFTKPIETGHATEPFHESSAPGRTDVPRKLGGRV